MTFSSSQKNTWSEIEDVQLDHFYQMLKKDLVAVKSLWNEVAKHLPGRSNEQCRRRWRYKFDPTKNRDKWSLEEDAELVSLHIEFGSKWSKIGKLLNNRSDISVKNRFFSLKRKTTACNEYHQNNEELVNNFTPDKLSIATLKDDDLQVSQNNFKKARTQLELSDHDERWTSFTLHDSISIDKVHNEPEVHKISNTLSFTASNENLNNIFDDDIFQLFSADENQLSSPNLVMSEESNVNSICGRVTNYVANCEDAKLNFQVKKNVWSDIEDEQLTYYYNFCKEKGELKSIWNEIAKYLPGRSNEQCRKRWKYKLDPALKHDAWTREDDVMLVKMYTQLGKKWADIGKLMDNRSDIEVKNRFLVLERQNKKIEKLRDVPSFNSPQSQERFLASDSRNEMLTIVEFQMPTSTKETEIVMIPNSQYNNNMNAIRPHIVTPYLVRLGLY